MRHSILFFVQLVLAVGCFAQQQPFLRFEDNPVWGIHDVNYGGTVISPVERGFLYSYTDTIWMCGYRYDIINAHDYVEMTGYVRSDGLKTFLRTSESCSDKEYLMYDFGVSEGDSIYVPYDLGFQNEDTILAVVQSVASIEYAGISRKTISLSGYASMNWIEGIGSDRHTFYPLTCLFDGCEGSLEVLCADSSGHNLLEFGCDSSILYLGIQQEKQPKLTIYPNPSHGSLQIFFKEFASYEGSIFKVVNSLGELVMEKKVRSGIEKIQLPTGMYVVSLVTETGSTSKKVVILPPG